MSSYNIDDIKKLIKKCDSSNINIITELIQGIFEEEKELKENINKLNDINNIFFNIKNICNLCSKVINKDNLITLNNCNCDYHKDCLLMLLNKNVSKFNCPKCNYSYNNISIKK